ncbi:MAG: type II secretion system F family protein [Anaerolineaceae bacterium]|nr:type II secretion system F family protein [Anaerolineaceae bacterium]
MSSNLIIGLVVLGALVIGGSIFLIIIGRRNPSDLDDEAMQERLNEFLASGENITLEELEMSQPLVERVIYPMARKLGEFAMRFTPQNVLESTKTKIEHSGMGGSIDPTMLLAARFIASLFLGGFFAFIFSIGSLSLPVLMKLVLIAFGAILGFYLPNLLLQSRINRRQKNILRALPDALDLLTICVEAGLGFDAAMAKVSEKWQTDLSLEFARVNREIQLGKTRRDALRDMATRLGVAELTSFVAAVIQSEQLGVSLAKVLRIQADQMRIRRRQYAEQEAHKAPLKMLIPMILLIFPALLLVLLIPAAFQLLNSAVMGAF